MFADLAPDYDRWNRILSMGLDRRWRVRAVRPLAGCERVCDLGSGTGDMCRALLAQEGFDGQIVAVDPTPALWRARSPWAPEVNGRCCFAVAEGEHLPLADGSCDGLMSGFVMRNFFDLDLALGESARVVRPGGTAVFLEMGHPSNRLWRALFELYFQRLAPAVASRLAGSGDAYRYLPGSLARFPAQAEVQRRFVANGWRAAEYKEYLGGAVVVYRATK
jgi:demethylmenaquinone methyltransferase/2-methoxy-6-polyprenyl-1,4-benzoquinol methylase